MEVVPISPTTAARQTITAPSAPVAASTATAAASVHVPAIASPTRKRPREFGLTPPLSPAAIPKKTTGLEMAPTATVPVAIATAYEASATNGGSCVAVSAAPVVDEVDQSQQQAKIRGGGGFADVPLMVVDLAAVVGDLGGASSSNGGSCNTSTQAELMVSFVAGYCEIVV